RVGEPPIALNRLKSRPRDAELKFDVGDLHVASIAGVQSIYLALRLQWDAVRDTVYKEDFGVALLGHADAWLLRFQLDRWFLTAVRPHPRVDARLRQVPLRGMIAAPNRSGDPVDAAVLTPQLSAASWGAARLSPCCHHPSSSTGRASACRSRSGIGTPISPRFSTMLMASEPR